MYKTIAYHTGHLTAMFGADIMAYNDGIYAPAYLSRLVYILIDYM